MIPTGPMLAGALTAGLVALLWQAGPSGVLIALLAALAGAVGVLALSIVMEWTPELRRRAQHRSPARRRTGG